MKQSLLLHRHVFRAFILFVVTVQLLVSVAYAQARAPADIRILVDASAMTNFVDKSELRKVFSEVAVGSVYQEGDFVGVWAFGKEASAILPYGPLTEQKRKQFSSAIGTMQWRERERNLRVALQSVLFDNSQTNAKPTILLITGGGNETGRTIRNALLDDYILNTLSSVMRRKQVNLQVLEIGNQGEPFYQKLIRNSGGNYSSLAGESDPVLSGIRYLAQAAGLTAEYTANNQFAMMSVNHPMSLIISSVPPAFVKLRHPEGWELTGSDTPTSIAWSQFSSNTLIRITPEALSSVPADVSYWSVEGIGRKRALLLGRPIAYLAGVEPTPDQLIALADRRPKPEFARETLPAVSEEVGFGEEFDFGGFDIGAETAGWFKGEVGIEARAFPKEGQNKQDRLNGSLRLQPEIDYLTEEGSNLFEITLFGRLDSSDSERSHYDVRELIWTHIGDAGWETKVGIGKVFWGVTESLHLVDIINQTDAVESIDGEDKLGQPMVKFAYESEWGNIDVYWLWYFRERTFPGKDGRLGSPIEIDTDNATYASDDEDAHQDFAFRYSNHWDTLDYAISWFSGTSREPVFQFNGDFAQPKLIPHYTTIDQAGLELQYILGQWLLKFEGISRSGVGDRYTAVTTGFEYTQVGIMGGDSDLGWLIEYLWDDRGDSAATPFEHDWFVGWRWTANDTASSEVLLGGIWDPESNDVYYAVEGSRRIAQNMKVSAEARVFSGGTAYPEDPLQLLNVLANPSDKFKSSALRYEDHVQVEFVYFF